MNKMGGDNRLTTFFKMLSNGGRLFEYIHTEAMASVAWWQLIYDKVRI